MESLRNKYSYFFLTLTAACCGLVWAFTNLGYDGEYQIAMCYRLLRGDKMFLEMWEPHQTSVFLPAALMWLYIRILGTTTGIVIYLQICGILIRGGIAVILYRTLRTELSQKVSYGIALLYFMISPKDYALPEFSNLQLWFSTLLLCSLCAYLKAGRFRQLVLSALWLCLEVLAYPSCAIVFPGVLLLLFLYSPSPKRDMAIITCICAGAGILVGGYFVCSLGPDTFGRCIWGMLSLEPTHTEGAGPRLLAYVKDALRQFLILAVTAAAGFLASLVPRLIPGRRKRASLPSLWLLCCCLILLAGFLANILSARDRCAYSVVFLFLAGLGFWYRNNLGKGEKQIYACAGIIGGLEFLATLLLSDLPLPVSVPYGLPMIVASLIPLEKQVASSAGKSISTALHCCFACFIMLLALRCAYIRTPLTGTEQICPTLPGIAIARNGPALGLISNEAGVYLQENSFTEWEQWIRPGEKVWIVGGVVDTLGYLYGDTEVACPSTISTPTYSEAVSAYWDLNPDKYPDVVIAESYMGSLSSNVLSNEWLVNWIELDFVPQQIIDGKYWRYYFREPR